MGVEAKEVEDLREKLNETILKLELARKDIRDIQKFHDRIEDFIDDFQDSISRIDKILEIQEIVSDNTEKTFDKKSKELAEHIQTLRDDYAKELDKLKKTLTNDLSQSTEPLGSYDERLRTVEKFQWKWAGLVLGAAIVISFLAGKMPNPASLFGG